MSSVKSIKLSIICGAVLGTSIVGSTAFAQSLNAGPPRHPPRAPPRFHTHSPPPLRTRIPLLRRRLRRRLVYRWAV
jgi:hypothetical protein